MPAASTTSCAPPLLHNGVCRTERRAGRFRHKCRHRFIIIKGQRNVRTWPASPPRHGGNVDATVPGTESGINSPLEVPALGCREGADNEHRLDRWTQTGVSGIPFTLGSVTGKYFLHPHVL